jgi:tRNA (cytidine/uridine-2'-O-)-methyltransferase
MDCTSAFHNKNKYKQDTPQNEHLPVMNMFCGLGLCVPDPSRYLLSPMVHIVLFKPEIHPNTGNIARLCAANGLPLHLVGDLGFRIDDRSVRRAGLDYWPHVDLHRQADLEELRRLLPDSRFFYFSAHAGRLYTDVRYRAGDCLVFGPETSGLPRELIQSNQDHALKIPMRTSHVRCLNLSSAVAIAAYEALRQIPQIPSSTI